MPITCKLAPPLPAYPDDVSQKVWSSLIILLNIRGLPPEILVSLAVNGEFYFTSLLLGFPCRLVVALKPVFRLTACSELMD